MTFILGRPFKCLHSSSAKDRFGDNNTSILPVFTTTKILNYLLLENKNKHIFTLSVGVTYLQGCQVFGVKGSILDEWNSKERLKIHFQLAKENCFPFNKELHQKSMNSTEK